jgi:hypothetical protein
MSDWWLHPVNSGFWTGSWIGSTPRVAARSFTRNSLPCWICWETTSTCAAVGGFNSKPVLLMMLSIGRVDSEDVKREIERERVVEGGSLGEREMWNKGKYAPSLCACVTSV